MLDLPAMAIVDETVTDDSSFETGRLMSGWT